MFRNDHGRQSLEDILLSDSLRDLSAAPLSVTEFELDLDELIDSPLEIPESDWDVASQADTILNVVSGSNPKSNHLSFLQLSPPALQFETLPDTKVAAITSSPVSVQVQHPKSSPSFFQSSSFHLQQSSPVSGLYIPENHPAVVQAKLVAGEYSPAPYNGITTVAAVQQLTNLIPTSAVASPTDQEQQDHIVNSLSVSQMLAIASAFDHACQAEDLETGFLNWVASAPAASEAEIRAVRALFHAERWNFAKHIVMRAVKIVSDLRSAISDLSSSPSNTSKHSIGRTKKRASPKLASNPWSFVLENQPTADEHSKKRRLWP